MVQTRKVLHVIGGGEFGGAEQHIIQLLSLMPQHGVNGKVICFYEAEFSQALRERGIEVEVLKFGRFDFRLLSSLQQIFVREKPDIIHTHGVKANFFGRLAAKNNSQVPLITTIHSLLRYDYTNNMAYFFASKMEKWTRPFNDHFIAISYAIEQSLLKEGVSKEKISVVHHGIDFQRFSQGKPVLRDELSLPKDAFAIGVVSRLVKIKGIDYIIRAMPRVVQANPKSRLIIVGSGPEDEALRQLASDLGLQEHVHFVGFRQDIPDCLHSFNCFVSASLSEGLGLNVLEAMASGCPVAVTGVGGILDFTKHLENGLLVKTRSSDDIADKLLDLMAQEQLAEKLAAEARNRVEKQFSLEAMSANTVRVYERLLEETHV